jgi:hypothetical protein
MANFKRLVKGHDFSHANEANQMNGALAPANSPDRETPQNGPFPH